MKMKIFAFWVITFEPIKIQTRSGPQKDNLNLSFVKDSYVIDKKTVKHGHKMAIFNSPFLCIRVYTVYCSL